MFLRLCGVGLAAASVGDFHFFGAGSVAEVLHADRGAVQANAHRRSGVVELGVVCLGEDNIRHRIARDRIGNQFAYQQARDGGVAVGKVEEIFLGFFVGDGVAIHSLAGRGIELQAGETGQVESPCVLRGNRIDAHAKQRVAASPDTS